MSGRWDKKREDMPKASIFNYKVVIIVGIIVFAVSLAVAMSFPPIYAEIIGTVVEPFEEIGTDLDQSYHIAILTSQSLLMDKIDWNNCAILHKETKHYDPPIEYTWNQQKYTDLIDTCGEIP